MTVKVNDESLNDLLPSEMNTQLICPQFLPQDFLGGRHFAAEFTGALEFFFGDVLTWDDILDWHNEILPLSRLPLSSASGTMSPKGGEAKTTLTPSLSLETEHAIRRRKEVNSIPSPFGEGQADTPINPANQGEVPLNTANHYANRG